LPGALFGGAFVLFVPNFAEHVSKGLSGAVYGVILILLIYLMPSGVAGVVRTVRNSLLPRTSQTSSAAARNS
jgi:branched-chain amino acid transport system permease protein